MVEPVLIWMIENPGAVLGIGAIGFAACLMALLAILWDPADAGSRSRWRGHRHLRATSFGGVGRRDSVRRMHARLARDLPRAIAHATVTSRRRRTSARA